MTTQTDIVAAVIPPKGLAAFKQLRADHPDVNTALHAGSAGTQFAFYQLLPGMRLSRETLCEGVRLRMATDEELKPHPEHIRSTWPLVPEDYCTAINDHAGTVETISEALVEPTIGAPKSAPTRPTPTQLDILLAFARQGVGVFPLAANTKNPAKDSNGHLDATTDSDAIRQLVHQSPSANWGLRPGPGSFIWDLDIKRDPATGQEIKNGVLWAQRWCQAQTPPIDFETLTTMGLVVQTAGGGLHIHLRSPRPIKQGTNLLGEKGASTGVDTRTAKGYGIAPTSKTPTGVYAFISNGPMLDAPEKLCEAIGYAGEPTPTDNAEPASPPPDIDQDRAADRATHYLRHEAPLAVEGTGGDECTFKVAARVKDHGVTRDLCCQLMAEHWNDRCTPPWDAEDLSRKVANAYAYGSEPVGIAAPEVEFAIPPELSTDAPTKTPSQSYDELVARTDTGNAALLIAASKGNLRFVVETKTWLHWDGGRWQETTSRSVARRYARRVAEHYYREAATYERKHVTGAATQTEDERKRHTKILDGMRKWELFCQSVKAINAMIDLASTMPGVEVSAIELNTHPWLLGVKNGVVDLQTGQLRPTAREELITKHCPVAYAPAATAPRWVRFIDEITGCPGTAKDDYRRRPRLAAYLHRALGYGLTGRAVEDKLFIATGGGANGKNECLDRVAAVMGEYAAAMPPEALMQTRYGADAERPTPNTAGLFGVRLALSSESKEGQKLDLAVVKRHTGGGTLTARRMRENAITWEITHKLWLMTNVVPGMDHLDPAIKGRLHVIPFDRTWNRPGHPDPDPTLPDGDKHLGDTLKTEAEGILAWLVAGAVAYHMIGLDPPEEVVQKTKGVYTEQDSFNQWLAECGMRCETKDGTRKSVLLVSYNQWAQGTDRPLMTDALFLAALKLNKHHNHPHKVDGQTVRLYDIRLTDFAPLAATGLDLMQSEAFN